MMVMKRRDFIKTIIGGGLTLSTGAWPLLSNAAGASGSVLVNLTLLGGPDFRHLFPPAFSSNSQSYGYRYWKARAGAHGLSDVATAWLQRWQNDYDPVISGGTNFGILKKCGWLKSMWEQGNVAILNNIVGAQTRDHVHAQMVLDQANVRSGPLDIERSGYGGRLAAAAGGNVVSLTAYPRRFCYGPDPLNPQGHKNHNLMDMANTRDAGFYRAIPGQALGVQATMARSLETYYAALNREMPKSSNYRRFVDMYALRQVGDAVTDRLKGLPIPPAIAAFYRSSGPTLSNPYFGAQLRNLYDALACQDLLKMKVASLELPGWDSHRSQKGMIEPLFMDLFGTDKAFDTLYKLLPADTKANLVFVIAGEFGRQLRANGDGGTDHGRGTSVLVIGNPVRGGLYGEMFPESELEILHKPSPDIAGLTEYDHAFAPIVDWLAPGKGLSVFPNMGNALREPGVDFFRLFA